MVLSNFSHVEIWHFGLNMLAFSSFAGGILRKHASYCYLFEYHVISHLSDVLGDKGCCAKSLAFLITAGEKLWYSFSLSPRVLPSSIPSPPLSNLSLDCSPPSSPISPPPSLSKCGTYWPPIVALTDLLLSPLTVQVPSQPWWVTTASDTEAPAEDHLEL